MVPGARPPLLCLALRALRGGACLLPRYWVGERGGWEPVIRPWFHQHLPSGRMAPCSVGLWWLLCWVACARSSCWAWQPPAPVERRELGPGGLGRDAGACADGGLEPALGARRARRPGLSPPRSQPATSSPGFSLGQLEWVAVAWDLCRGGCPPGEPADGGRAPPGTSAALARAERRGVERAADEVAHPRRWMNDGLLGSARRHVWAAGPGFARVRSWCRVRGCGTSSGSGRTWAPRTFADPAACSTCDVYDVW